MEIECEKCGELCCVDEAKPGVWTAWCHECNDYATERNLFYEAAVSAADGLRDAAKYEGV